MIHRVACTLAIVTLATFAAAFRGPTAPDVSGVWILRIANSGVTNASTLELRQDGETLSGTNVSNIGTVRKIDGHVLGDSVKFAMPLTTGDDRFVSYAGVIVTADSVAGDVDLAGSNKATFTAVRRK